MKQNEYERIRYERIPHLHLFIVSISFRNAHLHRAWELGLVLKGRGRVRLRERTVEIGAGELLLLNPNQSHEIASLESAPVQILILQTSVHFCEEYMPALRRVEFDCPCLSACLTDGQRRAMADRMLDTARAYWQAEPYSQLYCVAQYCLVLRDLLRLVPHRMISDAEYASRTKKADRLARVTGYIDEHYSEPLRLSQLARAEGVTTAYLSHFLRDNLNITFQDYLNTTRFEKALQFIDVPGLSLLDICMECGFSDSRYLNKLFLQRFGCTAKEYRRRLAECAPVDGEAPEPSPDSPVATERIWSVPQSLAWLAECGLAGERTETDGGAD